jgi:hypothetical protein
VIGPGDSGVTAASRRFRFAVIRAGALRRAHTATPSNARPLGMALSASPMSLRRMAAMPARTRIAPATTATISSRVHGTRRVPTPVVGRSACSASSFTGIPPGVLQQEKDDNGHQRQRGRQGGAAAK